MTMRETTRTTTELEDAIGRQIEKNETKIIAKSGTWTKDPSTPGVWKKESEAPKLEGASTKITSADANGNTAKIESQMDAPAGFRTSEIKISVSANTKVNLGNYESADRSVFYTKTIEVTGNATDQEIAEETQRATRALQAMAEAENARIISLFANQSDASNAKGITATFGKIFQTFSMMAMAAFGLEPEVEVDTIPPRGLAGVIYTLKDTGDKFVFVAKKWLKYDAPST